jgi:hypothetical protein
MKYKNIYSAIHNFGASFTSLMNYINDGYVIDELMRIHEQQIDIEIDWLDGRFTPESMATARIEASVECWRSGLEKHLASQNVDLTAICILKFCWPARGRKFMVAVDDRGKEYKIYVNESK